LKPIVENGSVYVISSVVADENGWAYNINVDIAAGETTASQGLEKLILLTDVVGYLLDMEIPNSLVKE
jgi:acetylglutamate kinase